MSQLRSSALSAHRIESTASHGVRYWPRTCEGMTARCAQTMNEDEVTAAVVVLARYLRANPLACDSAPGIARWWFKPENMVSMNVLYQALEWLKSRGALEESVGADGRVRYRRRGDDAELDLAVAAREAIMRGNHS